MTDQTVVVPLVGMAFLLGLLLFAVWMSLRSRVKTAGQGSQSILGGEAVNPSVPWTFDQSNPTTIGRASSADGSDDTFVPFTSDQSTSGHVDNQTCTAWTDTSSYSGTDHTVDCSPTDTGFDSSCSCDAGGHAE